VLLPLTLVWKIMVYPGERPGQGQVPIQGRIVEFLVRQHFVVVVRKGETAQAEPTVQATSSGCRILVAESPSEGWGRDITRLYVTPEDAVFVVYDGKIYSEQPTWLTVYNTLWSKFPRALGLKVQTSPILTVVATKACEAERLPWMELR